MQLHLSADEIDGARVTRGIRLAGRDVPIGTVLSSAEVRGIPPSNLRSLIENRFLFVWPTPEAVGAVGRERFLVPRSGGKFDVVEGRRINDAPLSGEDARALVRDRN